MKKIIRLTESDLTRLVRRVIIESKKNPVYDEELCDAVLEAEGMQQNTLNKWYNDIKDKDSLSWFFGSADPRIEKHLKHINNKCVGDDKELTNSLSNWWYNLAVIWCSSLDDDYGRYNRELDRNPTLVMGCHPYGTIPQDNIKYPRRPGF
jgi:hypothetical protein